MADKDRFGKSSRSYAVDTPRERGIKKYHRNLSKGLGSGRNVRRIRKAREDRTLNRPPRWDQKVGKAVRSGFGKGKEGIMGLWDAGMKGLNAATNSWAEAQEARKDDKKWTYGGDPLDMAPGSMAHKWMQTQVLPEFQEDFEEEVSKGNLHWTELGDFTGGQSGLAERINVLNNLTPERLEGYSPIKQRNILESIVNPAEADAFRRSDAGQEGILNNAMLMDYINQAKELYGSAGLPAVVETDDASNVTPDYGDLRFYGTYPSTEAGTEQLGLAEDLTPFEIYKMRSQAQDRGGFTGPKLDKPFPIDMPAPTDYSTILSQAGLDPNVIEYPRIANIPPGFAEEEEEIYVDPLMKYAGYGQ